MQEKLRAALHDAAWLWVGSAGGFVPASQVAFACPANAAPYLYAVPPDLACFSKLLQRFGVRPAFTSGDFVQVTRHHTLH
jgi:hypothetical protein